ncbi:hypothetical protein PYW07_016813 [Mythimna separata]|uniref:Uncharacterized protein n=1 Tax=Mythimna separata TaxID=271217 RepID=A0AAD7YLA8_MYTSE|nr:hypothetical protein PYW07_016813 [Mythimna separata]
MAHKIPTFSRNSALRKCVHPLCCTKLSDLRESWRRPLVLSGDMLRNRGLVLLTIIIIIYQSSTEQIINTDGWIPMSQHDIYNQISRVSTKYLQYPVYRSMKPPIVYDNNLVQRLSNTKSDFRDFKESFEVLNEKSFEIVAAADETEEKDKKIINNEETTRTAKKVRNQDADYSILNNLEPPNSNAKTSVTSEEKTNNEVITATATSKAYEVTEDTDKLATENNYIKENVGYQYDTPTDENQNLTSSFYEILSKYNINSEDKLQNYDLSLQRKAQTLSERPYRVPLPHGFNNLNHLPVDPLLAVFLSNYGFYLPSLYGIKANYNNLYGYLASNNIHNNKPFGLYKVFSDTDSWN